MGVGIISMKTTIMMLTVLEIGLANGLIWVIKNIKCILLKLKPAVIFYVCI